MEKERRSADSWGRAIATTMCIVFAVVIAFAIVPDRLAQLVERRSRSLVLRDLVLAVWFFGAVAATVWGLVRFQGRGMT